MGVETQQISAAVVAPNDQTFVLVTCEYVLRDTFNFDLIKILCCFNLGRSHDMRSLVTTLFTTFRTKLRTRGLEMCDLKKGWAPPQ